MSQELIVFVTAPNNEEAARIADSLVSERLAACVNIVGGIESIYRWEGEVARDREALLIIKTTDVRYDELERHVKELHTYTMPEVIAYKIERGSDAYLEWLRASTTRGEAPES
ncbi:MAG TPA: divalent-cation tolerance protein CutA [Blastocatellia bacterium]